MSTEHDAPNHTAMAPVVLPPGTPPSNPDAPKRALTQEQIDAIRDGVFALFPAVKAYWPLIVAVVTIVASSSWFTARFTAPTPPPVIIEKLADKEKPPIIVNVNPPNPGEVTPPSPIAPPTTQVRKLTLYSTAAVDAKAVAAELAIKHLSVAVVVDHRAYEVGSTYPFRGKRVAVPCAALAEADGKVIAVAPFATSADVEAFVQKHQEK